jgi:hypothetical protein
MTKLHAILIRSASTSGAMAVEEGTKLTTYAAPFVDLKASQSGAHPFAGDSVTFTAATAPVTIIIDIHAGA